MQVFKNINEIKNYRFNDTIENIINLIKKSKNIAILSHKEPDGDAIGSQIGLLLALKNAGHKVDVINVGPFDNKFAVKYKKYYKKEIDENYDLYIVVDTPDIDRIGFNEFNIPQKKIVVIDHHFTNSQFGIINWVDTLFLSSSEMIFLLLFKMDVNFEGSEICQHLLNGIISDTGYFLHLRKENKFSLLASYILIDNGADPRISYNIMFGGKNINSKKLLALALQRIETIHHGKIAWTYLNDVDKKKFGNAAVDSVDIFKEMLSISNICIVIYFKISKKKIDISFRSNEMIDVASLAKRFGGGGHKMAAGATLKGKFDIIKEKVLNSSVDYLKKNQENN
jgi:phosphoesterase RecJ-like protein